MGCLSFPHTLRVIEIALCAMAMILPMFKSMGPQPYNVWCEFVWTFGLLTAIVILLLEFCKLELVVRVFLEHSWEDLATGLTLLCFFMSLAASVIFPMRVMCSSCILHMIACIASAGATLVFMVDGVMAKMKILSSGYLSGGRGILRVFECLFACILCNAYGSYFIGVDDTPIAMVWCMLVYLVCFVASLITIPCNLIKLLKILCSVKKMEVTINVMAVILYITAMILWPIYGLRNYYDYMKWDNDTRKYIANFGYRYNDLMAVVAFTAINLLLYIVDMILSLLALNRI